MNKSFFTKWLVVEGEVKEGDIALKPEFYWRDNQEQDVYEPPYYEICGPKDFERDYVDYKLAKLFVCSRDIKEGDKLQIQQYNGDDNWYATFEKEDYEGHYSCKFIDVHNNMSFGVMAKDAIKVVGEVSKDALTFVNEGQEFTEEELEPYLYYNKHPDESIYFDDMEDFMEWSRLNPNPQIYTPTVNIKCSNCKHFQ